MNDKLKGIPAAPGIVIGPAYLAGADEFSIAKEKIKESDIPLQIELFEEAIIKTRKEIIELQKRIAEEMGSDEAAIFDAHLLVLEDRMLIEDVISRLKKERLAVPSIFQEVLKKYINVFSNIEDEYLKERISDINDVGRRILRNLLGQKRKGLEDLKERVIVVSHDISPSDTAAMNKKNVAAFVTDVGGRTSHTAIMAKSIEIPAVVGLEKATSIIKTGDILIVDGTMGLVIINPDKETLKDYQKQEKKNKDIVKKLISLKNLPAQTKDNKKIMLSSNIELPDEIPSVIEHGSEGIGLYRTEYFYMNRLDLPTEDEHYEAYKYVLQAVAPHSVIIRTLDLGGDKFISQLKVPKEMLSFLGWRAIRFCLARPDIFKVQLRAALRASVHGRLKIMYPMISGIEELKQTNHILDEVKNELKTKKIPFDKNIEVGAMIEVPSAAMTADVLSKEVDFFSIGTNDLIQYSLAVDRTNEKIAYLYEPAHPAVLRFIKNIIEGAHKNNIWVGMCGEMAGDLEFVPLLLGMGLDEFSVPAYAVPEVKEVIRSINYSDAVVIADKAVTLSTVKEIKNFINESFAKLVPELAQGK